jgi:hypothetical protein
MISKCNRYLKMGNLAVLFLIQLVDVGINDGSRYAQSIVEMLVRNLSSCLGLQMLHSEDELLT